MSRKKGEDIKEGKWEQGGASQPLNQAQRLCVSNALKMQTKYFTKKI